MAIGAPDRDWMSYGGLRALSADVAEALHAQGIGRGRPGGHRAAERSGNGGGLRHRSPRPA